MLTIVRATGSREEEARDVADHLVGANLAGHDSHGVGMLPDYVRMVQAGLLVPNQDLETLVDRRRPAASRRRPRLRPGDGRGGHARAASSGPRRRVPSSSPCATARMSGRVGHYGEQCAAAGMASVHFVNVGDHDPLQAPYGCSDARLGTNPFCAGLAGGDGRGVRVLDMATSAIAFGKARVARNKGVPVPPDTVIDAHGRPTTDPTALVDEQRGRAQGLRRAQGLGPRRHVRAPGRGADRRPHHRSPHHPREGGIVNSMLSIVIDPAALGDPAAIRREVAAIGEWIKASPPAPGFAEVLLPGRARARAVREAPGRGHADRRQEPRRHPGRRRSLGLPRPQLDRTLGR